MPISGKYMPTHASKAKRAATSGTSAPPNPSVIAASMARVAIESIPAIVSSAGTPARLSAEKSVEPIMQHTMKHEKTVPNGTLTPAPSADLSAGGHCSTKMYIAPSKRACVGRTTRSDPCRSVTLSDTQ